MVSQLSQHNSGNGLLPGYTKPLPEPNVDFSFSGPHATFNPRTITKEISKLLPAKMCLDITHIHEQPRHPGTIELIVPI